MTTEEVLFHKFGPLLTLVQVAEILDRSPDGCESRYEPTTRLATRCVVRARRSADVFISRRRPSPRWSTASWGATGNEGVR